MTLKCSQPQPQSCHTTTHTDPRSVFTEPVYGFIAPHLRKSKQETNAPNSIPETSGKTHPAFSLCLFWRKGVQCKPHGGLCTARALQTLRFTHVKYHFYARIFIPFSNIQHDFFMEHVLLSINVTTIATEKAQLYQRRQKIRLKRHKHKEKSLSLVSSKKGETLRLFKNRRK